jgi:hypothetical protein
METQPLPSMGLPRKMTLVANDTEWVFTERNSSFLELFWHLLVYLLAAKRTQEGPRSGHQFEFSPILQALAGWCCLGSTHLDLNNLVFYEC